MSHVLLHSIRSSYAARASYDRLDFFKSPVSKIEVPDYYDIIQRPICWNVIEQKLDRCEYIDLQDFKVRLAQSWFLMSILECVLILCLCRTT